MALRLYCLHGFLGRPADWQALAEAVAGRLDPVAVDLFADPALYRGDSLEAWAERFRARVELEAGGTGAALVGYSLGGRLALHALLAAPRSFRFAVLVSTHTGLATEAERRTRRAADRRWARRFLDEPWPPLLSAWNRQPVLASGPRPAPRRERDFRRERLAAALVAWSLGRQQDLRPRLAALEVETLWLAGERDTRYARLAGAAARASGGRAAIVPGAGHRLPWEQPAALARAVRDLAPGGGTDPGEPGREER
jgi:2-succinyl-6-hydroxy-2,4-cyclohexadiene-1-carboxylate synthase